MKKVFYLVENKTSAQYRYRVQNVMEALEKSKEWQVEVFLRSEIKKMIEKLDETNLVVILRQTDKAGAIKQLINQIHEAEVKVLFDLDDLIFDYRDLLMLMRTTKSKNIFYWLGYFWGIRRVAENVDGFICTNKYLAEKLKRSFGRPVGVVPNSLNREQVKISEEIVKRKSERKTVKDGFAIGYFSGSPTHVRDFQMVEPELVKFLNKHEDANLRVVGYMDFSNEMKKLIFEKKVEVLDLVDYLKLQKLMAEVDVNIAPLVINEFTNCKSELKFFEAAAVETITIASPAYTFSHAITDGKNGYLARPGEWYKKLEYLYEYTDGNRKVAKAAKEYALKHYYGKEFSETVEEIYGYFTKA